MFLILISKSFSFKLTSATSDLETNLIRFCISLISIMCSFLSKKLGVIIKCIKKLKKLPLKFQKQLFLYGKERIILPPHFVLFPSLLFLCSTFYRQASKLCDKDGLHLLLYQLQFVELRFCSVFYVYLFWLWTDVS